MSLIDHATLNELREALGNELDSIVKLYVDGLPAQCAELVALLDAGNLPTLRRSAHSLKGSSVSMGATQLGTRAAQIEKMAAAGENTEALRQAVTDLQALSEATVSAFIASGWVSR